MINWLMQPWPWWLSGILIGLMVPGLYLLAGRSFGISGSLQSIGALCTPNASADYIRGHDWRSNAWKLIFAVGIMLGAFVAVTWLSAVQPQFLPTTYRSFGGVMRLLIGGIFVGFGTRYAGGCTSGHAITGISNLNLPSLIATIFFFVGGLAVTWGLGSLIF